MLYRVAGSQATLLIVTFAIMIGCAGIMTEEVEFLIENYNLNFIPAETALEENIAILVAAFGVFLEHRRYLLNQIHPDGIPEQTDQFDRYAHRVGVMLILLAITIEAINLLFLALDNWDFNGSGIKYAEIGILFFLNLIACIMLAVFALRAIRSEAPN